MKISIEWTPRTYFLKGAFFLLVFLLIAIGYSVSHTWSSGRIVFVALGFALVCLEFALGFRLRNRVTQS